MGRLDFDLRSWRRENSIALVAESRDWNLKTFQGLGWFDTFETSNIYGLETSKSFHDLKGFFFACRDQLINYEVDETTNLKHVETMNSVGIVSPQRLEPTSILVFFLHDTWIFPDMGVPLNHLL